MLDKYSAAKCTTTEQAVIRLIAAAFGGEKLNKNNFADTDWYAVFDELKAQAAAAIPMDVLTEVEELIPTELFNEWLMYSVQVMNYAEIILSAQSELTELFLRRGIPMGILKGAAASCNYPYPLYRNMGDIDFLVDKKDFDSAYKLMLDNGYVLVYEEDHVEYHLTLEKDGIMYELHREPAGIPHGTKGDKLRLLFTDICSQYETASLGEYRFCRLPLLQNGLVLLLHIVKHLDEGLGIRQICDWMAFVSQELSDEIWESEFKPMLKNSGLEKLACITTKMCKLYFGLNGITWCDGADETACADLMRFVLDNGNFGHKDRSTNRAGAVLGSASAGKRRSILVNLQKQGTQQWKVAQKIPLLRCVAWAYLPIRYLIRIITGKRSIKYTAHLAETIGKNKSLQDKLAVFK